MSVSAGDPVVVSIIVPVLRDTAVLSVLLARPRDARDQWIVVNGDPSDWTVEGLRATHPDVCWLDAAPGRGTQLGAGAAQATGAWVMFLHADTSLPDSWRDEVTRAALSASYEWGCFRLRFDSSTWQARLIEAAVRLRVRVFRLPYGDQAMFVRRETLEAIGGVPPVPLMEDVMLATRLARRGRPFRSALSVVTSARRWERDGWWRRSAANLWVLTQYLLGVPPEQLAGTYTRTRPC